MNVSKNVKPQAVLRLCACLVAILVMYGCATPAPRNLNAIGAYYRYDFAAAREGVRGPANVQNDEQVVLNNVRLGLAALADGDLREAEQALGRSFELLSTAGLNKDRTVGAVLLHEGVRIWKGEPFEQALTYHYVSTLYALMGDWENARAAAANALFRLTDFGGDQSAESLARRAAKQSDYLERGYTAVDTNFALGFLMQAIASDLSGAPGMEQQLDAAIKINPNLQTIADAIRQREYDTLLLVDYGKGPTKIAYGPDEALVKFVPQERHRGPLVVMTEGVQVARVNPVCDVNAMAQDHRWNNLEDVRRAKSIIGDVLLAGGTVATFYGADRDDRGVALAGIAAMAAGLLMKSGARADTRYCEYMPQSIFLVPLKLDRARDLRVQIEGDAGSMMVLSEVQPGSLASPRVVHLRVHGADSPKPAWLSRRNPTYSNDVTGVFAGPQGFPWILGGSDVSTPSEATLRAYQDNGYLIDFNLPELISLYAAEGIVIGSGMENREGVARNPSYRHILEGGSGLFTPHSHSMGYQRIMCGELRRYEPQSEVVRNIAALLRVRSSG